MQVLNPELFIPKPFLTPCKKKLHRHRLRKKPNRHLHCADPEAPADSDHQKFLYLSAPLTRATAERHDLLAAFRHAESAAGEGIAIVKAEAETPINNALRFMSKIPSASGTVGLAYK
jgi:hypothetical protein